MFKSISSRFSRRDVIVGLTALSLIGSRQSATTQPANNIPYDLGHGLEIRDYRLFPTEDVTRFLVEIHNTTDTAIDTPSVGVRLPGFNDENFGWAIPMHEVLHPHSSAGLIGVAPQSLRDDEDWGTPEWILCNDLLHVKADKLDAYHVEFTHTLTIHGPSDFGVNIEIMNSGDPLPTTVTILGLVRDHNHRIAGGTVQIYLNKVEPGETRTIPVRVGPNINYIANPAPLVSTEEGVTVDFSLQPWPSSQLSRCEPVMPWVRN